MGNSTIRGGREIKINLTERLGTIKALLDVERFSNKRNDDESEVLFDDDFSSVELFDDAEEVGAAQERQDKTKRIINPTNRLGTNVALKDRQHLYATESRTYQKNCALLMIPDVPMFPVNVLSVYVFVKSAQ